MPKLVLAVEGADGSGKSTVIEYLVNRLVELDVSSSIVDRVTGDGSAVDQLTHLIRKNVESGGCLQVDMSLRVAREFIRAELARESKADVIILDRFVVSDQSRARINGTETDFAVAALQTCADAASLSYTLYCDCPFEVGWKRVNARSSLSPKERLGREYNESLHRYMCECIDDYCFRGNVVVVDTSRPLTCVQEQINMLADLMAQCQDLL